MRRRFLLATLLAAACSDPAPSPVPVTPEAEPVADEATPPEPEPEPVPAPDAPTILELPEAIPVPATLRATVRTVGDPDEGETSWPVVEHPVPEVRAILASMVGAVAEEVRDYAGYGTTCRATLATEALVSVTCDGFYDTRGGMGLASLQLHLAIAEGRVHPVDIDDAFVDTDVEALAEARCAAEYERRLAATPEDERDDVEGGCDYVHVSFGPRGVVAVATDWRSRTTETILPYAELRDRIRADGPLAPVLADRPARLETVDEADATGWAVTEFGLASALVRRWMEVDPASAANLMVDDFGGGLARLVLPGTDAEAARRVARSLGAEATPVRFGAGSGRLGRLYASDFETMTAEREALTLQWVRTTEDLNLRSEADASQVDAVLPAGSLVAAIGGALRARGAHVSVVTALGCGTLAARHLRAYSGCVLAPGEDDRHVARVPVRDHGEARDAWLVVSRRGAGSHVALHARDGDSCALGPEILAVDVERPAVDVRLTGTTEHGGTSLLLVGTPRGREAPLEMRYRVWRAGSRGAVFDETFELERERSDTRVRTSETADGAYFPLTLALRGGALRRLAWDGERLSDVPPAAP